MSSMYGNKKNKVHCCNRKVHLPGIHGEDAVSFRTVGDFSHKIFPEADNKISTSPEIVHVNFPINIGKISMEKIRLPWIWSHDLQITTCCLYPLSYETSWVPIENICLYIFWNLNVYTYIYIYIYLYIFIYTYMYIFINIYCVCVYICMYMFMYVYIYTYTYITYIYLCIHLLYQSIKVWCVYVYWSIYRNQYISTYIYLHIYK